ncbi:MAG: hypothetical protein DHS20C21_09400 [Gemmatimonadota bacterium]|nr:MAG: hypothetical protein DHS20C21_09400 [Gemmatimonadota bacterium]
MIRARLFCLVPLLLISLSACATFNASDLSRILDAGGPLDEGTIVNGLKQALEVGSERAVGTTSAPGGFLNNARIRIPLPGELEGVARTLRVAGMGSYVEEFEVAMNHAAEKATGEAVSVFWGAIRQMTFSDAREILGGADDAATSFFRARTEEELNERFAPIVNAKMAELGYLDTYDRLIDGYAALPLTSRPEFDPRSYVTGRALDGLFVILADEEKRIRDDPAARTTDLLRRVFSSAG